MKKGKTRNKSSRRRNDDNVVMFHDNQARLEGPKKKKWTIHDLRQIQPLTDTQYDMFRAWLEGTNVAAFGSAGTGKSFIALYLAFHEMLDRGEHQQIIIVRTAVAGREIGHLPGDKEEKEEVFELPYNDICADLFGRKSTYKDMKEAGKIKFVTTSHIRGLTWDNSIVIVDEMQNMTFSEIDSIITRLGTNSRIIFAGDHKKQCDLKHYEETGVDRLIAATEKMKSFTNIEFTYDDVVRSGLVKEWLKVTDQS